MNNLNTSKNIAKNRLKYMLINDRVSCTAETLSMIKKDVYRTISNYMPISDNIELYFEHNSSDNTSYISAKIPLNEVTR